jgi:hypothetical protein
MGAEERGFWKVSVIWLLSENPVCCDKNLQTQQGYLMYFLNKEHSKVLIQTECLHWGLKLMSEPDIGGSRL